MKQLLDLVIRAIGFLVVGVYRLFFAWWLDGLLSGRSEERLKNRVRDNLGFLFSEHNGQFTKNDRVCRWGNVVSLEAGGVLFRIGHHRGEDFVDVTSPRTPSDWEPVGIALMAIDAKQPITTSEDLPVSPSFLVLSEIAPLLRSRFADLEEAYSVDRYPTTKRTLETIHAFPRYGRVGMLARGGAGSGLQKGSIRD